MILVHDCLPFNYYDQAVPRAQKKWNGDVWRAITEFRTFDEIDVEVIEFNPEPGSKVTKVPLEEINFPEDSIVGVINHHGNLSIARGETQLTEEDTALVFAKSKAIPKLRQLFEA